MKHTRTVLYVHGLESGPDGNKPRSLRASGFEVVSRLMPCGRRQIARDPVVIATALGSIATGAALTARFGLRGLALSAATYAASKDRVKQALTRRMVERSVQVQLRTLAEHKIDVVMGSSFGGAIALELLRRGAWKGPTVLLCPAHERVCEREGRPWVALDSLSDAQRAQCLIVHAREDEVVPYEHSVRLAAQLGVELETVSDDHRLSQSATDEGLRRWIERVVR